MPNKPALLILAAGLGSRYGSLKQIDRIGPSGERIIDYSVYDAIRAGFGKIVYVIRKSFEQEFKEVIIDSLPKNIESEYVFQELDSVNTESRFNTERLKPWGTGHALLSAASAINNSFAVINADDFYGANSFKLACDFLTSTSEMKTEHALIGFKLVNTLSEYGTVSRGICEIDDYNYITSIIERTEIKKENEKISYKDNDGNWVNLTGEEIISMNMFAFKPSVFSKFYECFSNFIKIKGNDLKSEFYLPFGVDQVIKSEAGKVNLLITNEQWFGLTYIEDKKIVREKINNLVKQGFYPTQLW